MNSTLGSTDYDPSQWNINWRLIADDIRDAGLNYGKQASVLGLKWSTLQRWVNGSEPKYSIARSWLVLHTHMCGSDKTQMRFEELLKKTEIK